MGQFILSPLAPSSLRCTAATMVMAVGLGVVGAAGLLVVRTAALATDLPLYTLKLMGCPTEMNRTSTDAPPEIFRASSSLVPFLPLKIVGSAHKLSTCCALDLQ
jgi:hypothetical protein